MTPIIGVPMTEKKIKNNHTKKRNSNIEIKFQQKEKTINKNLFPRNGKLVGDAEETDDKSSK